MCVARCRMDLRIGGWNDKKKQPITPQTQENPPRQFDSGHHRRQDRTTLVRFTGNRQKLSHNSLCCMSEPIEKPQALALISEGIADAETAIRSHPDDTHRAYEEAVAAFLEGARGASESEWTRAMDLQLSELRLLHRYLLAMSFISAWYELHGDKHRRDKAAQSASLLVAGLGIDPEQAMKKCIVYENAWKRMMRSRGIGPSRAGCIGALVGLLVVVVTIFALL